MLVCGCATGYQRQTWTGGYSNLKIQDDIFKVRFKGNGYCGISQDKVLRYAKFIYQSDKKLDITQSAGS